MYIGLSILGLLLSYAVAVLGFAALFTSKRFPFQDPLHNLLIALPLGPIGLAWFQWIYLQVLPGLAPPYYLALTVGPFLILSLLLSQSSKRILRSLARLPLRVAAEIFPRDSYGRRAWTVSFIWLGGIILLVVSLLQLLGMPVVASDPLEYASLAEVIYTDRSLSRYPLDPSTEQGFYARSAHPPAFHMMIVFSYFWQGAADSSRLLRFIQVHYLVAFVAVAILASRLACRSGDARDMAGSLALLFTMSVPFYVALSMAFHVDPMRIALFLTGFVFSAQLLLRERQGLAPESDADAGGLNSETPSSRGGIARRSSVGTPSIFSAPVLITGIAVGLGMFAHSIGLLLLPFAQAAYFFSTRSSFVRRCMICTVFGLVALAIGAGQYVQNTIEFGVPLHDTEPIWELPLVDHKTDVRFRRDLVTLDQRLKNGLFVWFNRPTLYGYIHQFALLSLLLFHRKIWSSVYGRVLTIGMIAFYALAILTMSLGVDMIIKNIRYMLTIMPFLIVIAAIGGGEIYARLLGFARRGKVRNQSAV